MQRHVLQRAERAATNGLKYGIDPDFMRTLYTFIIYQSCAIEDLAKAENDLAQSLRGELISVGLWIMREAEQIRLEKSDNFKGIIEVSKTIHDGLA